ncbi:MAG TPA: hypothetical protein VL381_00245 [Rhodocyclaceae bacterium]|jgi:hypothetical protein|nr:hypothetical protein [Rhodocyclaceae bacterium]
MKITPPLLSFSEIRSLSSAKSSSTGEAPIDDWQGKRLKKMQEALQQLKAMPTPQQAQKEAAKEKLAFLIERLRELKAMLMSATPAQAKALASQLKSIASQISSIAKLAGSGGGASSQISIPSLGATNPSASATAAASNQASSAATTEATAAATPIPAKPSDTSTATDSKTTIASSLKHTASTLSDDDKGLKQLLEEAKKLLREVSNLLRSKLSQKDKDAKSDLQSVDKSIAEIEASTSGGASAYTSLGGLISDSSAGNVSGLTINVSA